MPISEIHRRLRAFLDVERSQAEQDIQRYVYTLRSADLDSIYFDDINGFPARCSGGTFTAAVAGQLAYSQLMNPANSGVDVEVEGFIVSSGTAGLIDVRVNAAALGAAGSGLGRRDLRSSSAAVAQVRTGNEVAASGSARGLIRVVANTPFLFFPPSPPWCLGTLNGIHLEHQTVNTALDVLWFWREREPDRRRRA